MVCAFLSDKYVFDQYVHGHVFYAIYTSNPVSMQVRSQSDSCRYFYFEHHMYYNSVVFREPRNIRNHAIYDCYSETSRCGDNVYYDH